MATAPLIEQSQPCLTAMTKHRASLMNLTADRAYAFADELLAMGATGVELQVQLGAVGGDQGMVPLTSTAPRALRLGEEDEGHYSVSWDRKADGGEWYYESRRRRREAEGLNPPPPPRCPVDGRLTYAELDGVLLCWPCFLERAIEPDESRGVFGSHYCEETFVAAAAQFISSIRKDYRDRPDDGRWLESVSSETEGYYDEMFRAAIAMEKCASCAERWRDIAEPYAFLDSHEQ